MKATRVLESCLYADDLTAIERFYVDVLGLSVATRLDDRGVVFRCGEGVVIVFDPRVTGVPDDTFPTHGAVGAGHLAFVASADELDGWRAHLKARGVAIETEIDWPDGSRSIYFRDPAGNSVELAPPALWGRGE